MSVIVGIVKHVKSYFDTALPHVLAHRGLHTEVPENTLEAFRLALAAGATHIETDAHASADGVAVLVHDPTIVVGGRTIVVADLTAAELAALDLGAGEGIPSLESVLVALPEARFNIDVKITEAVGPVAHAIEIANASQRVLIASFKAARRTGTLRRLTGVATSSSATTSLLAVLLATVGLTRLGARALARVDAVQLPTTMFKIPVFTPRFIRMCHRAGVVVHAWTINEPDQMRKLLERGLDGIVTDRADLASDVVAQLKVA